ncbi:hypothetical protein tb265_40460 [Gemmatimonadetes bacterium T265]|nr:hypothetical protein tb265_40460 [Gemmatimonadetes bacterium T265]
MNAAPGARQGSGRPEHRHGADPAACLGRPPARARGRRVARRPRARLRRMPPAASRPWPARVPGAHDRPVRPEGVHVGVPGGAEDDADARALLDHTDELLCRTDAAGRLTFVNAAWRRALGYTAAEAARLTPVDVVAPEDRARYLAAARRLVAGAPVRDFEALLLAKDGRRVACRGWAVPRIASGPDGRPTCVGTDAGYRDVTAERRADRTQTRLAAALDAAPDFVALVAPDGGLAYVNRAGRHLVGLAEDADLAGVHLTDLQPAREQARMATIEAAARAGGTWTGESVLLGAAGLEVPVSLVLVPHPAVGADDVPLVSVVARDLRARVAAEGALAASEARFRALSAASPLGVFDAAPDGALAYVNPRMAALWRAMPDALLHFGWRDWVHPDDRDALLAGWTAANTEGAEFVHEFRIRVPVAPVDAASAAGAAADVTANRRAAWHRAGDHERPAEVRWVRVRSAVLPATSDGPARVVGTVEDVTERVERVAAKRRLTAILEASPDVVVVATPDGRLDYLNASGRRLLGVAGGPEAVRAAGLTVAAVQPQLAPDGPMAGAVAHAVREGVWRGETVLRKCDGRDIPVEQVLVAHTGADGAVEYLSATLRDVTERKQHEATLRALALVDALTGLYNRRGFLAVAEREWARAAAAGHGVVVVYADLDAFKAVNDTYGHAAGDRALAEVAGVLRRTFREADVVGRLGGDEFVAFARCGPGQDAAATAARVLARLDGELAAANARAATDGTRAYALGLSAGAAHTGGPEVEAAAPTHALAGLMAAADAALYDRKLARRQAPGRR